MEAHSEFLATCFKKGSWQKQLAEAPEETPVRKPPFISRKRRRRFALKSLASPAAFRAFDGVVSFLTVLYVKQLIWQFQMVPPDSTPLSVHGAPPLSERLVSAG